MVFVVKPACVAEIEEAQREHQLTCSLYSRGAATAKQCAEACTEIYETAAKYGYFIGVTESAFWRWQPWMEEPGYRSQKS